MASFVCGPAIVLSMGMVATSSGLQKCFKCAVQGFYCPDLLARNLAVGAVVAIKLRFALRRGVAVVRLPQRR
jgi:hypothetical protein